MVDRKVLRVTLRYTDINSLFERPAISPYSEDFGEYSTVSGIEHIYGELQASPSLKRVEATILLPPGQITPPWSREPEKPSDVTASRAGGRWNRANARCDGVRCAP